MSIPTNLLGRRTCEFAYTNWQGETERRRVVPDRVVWMDDPGFGYKAGWFLIAWDMQREALRQFVFDPKRMRPIDEREPGPLNIGRVPLSAHGINILLQAR